MEQELYTVIDGCGTRTDLNRLGVNDLTTEPEAEVAQPDVTQKCPNFSSNEKQIL